MVLLIFTGYLPGLLKKAPAGGFDGKEFRLRIEPAWTGIASWFFAGCDHPVAGDYERKRVLSHGLAYGAKGFRTTRFSGELTVTQNFTGRDFNGGGVNLLVKGRKGIEVEAVEAEVLRFPFRMTDDFACEFFDEGGRLAGTLRFGVKFAQAFAQRFPFRQKNTVDAVFPPGQRELTDRGRKKEELHKSSSRTCTEPMVPLLPELPRPKEGRPSMPLKP